MTELNAIFTQTQVFGNPAASLGKSYGNTGKGTDMFADIFRNVSDVGPDKPGKTDRNPPAPKQTDRQPKNPSGSNGSPEEISAAATTAGIQQSGQGDPANEENDPLQVVLILEGNKDIGSLQSAENPFSYAEIGRPEDSDGELTARMPEAGQPEKTEPESKPAVSGNTAKAPETGSEVEKSEIRLPETGTKEPEQKVAVGDEEAGPCPLENKNDNSRKGPHLNGGDRRETNGERESNRGESRIFAPNAPADISPERIASAESLSQAAQQAPRTATVPTLFDTLVQSISSPSGNYMEIQLKPDFLGKVAISLALGSEGLDIKIKADEASARNLIAGQIAQLSESLSEKGVKVNSIDVIYTGFSEQMFNGQKPKGDDGAGEFKFGGADPTDGISFGLGFTEDADAVSMVDAGFSSVEFRA